MRFLKIAFLLMFSAKVFGMSHTIHIDTLKIPQVATVDSVEYFKKEESKQRTIKSFKIIAAIATGAASVRNAFQADGYPMLIYGLLSIGLIFSALSKKRKPKPYSEYLEDKKEKEIKRIGDPKWNNAWGYSLLFGLIGMVSTALGMILSLEIVLIAGLVSLSCFLIALLLFFVGFKGEYKSKKEKRRGITKGVFGVFLPWLPLFILLLLILTDVINIRD